MLAGEEPTPEATDEEERNYSRMFMLAALAVFLAGAIVSLLGGYGYIQVDPVQVMGFTMVSVAILICCGSLTITGRIMAKMPEYGETEEKFRQAMELYENEEWEEASQIFSELVGPKMDHRRALYYGARCLEKMDRWEDVKKYIGRYLELQPKDKEAWELLATAHRRLFEYEEAEAAEEKARQMPSKD